ncbi:hypothetical protein BGZ46_003506, partial [Entomortierella lignicola]
QQQLQPQQQQRPESVALLRSDLVIIDSSSKDEFVMKKDMIQQFQQFQSELEAFLTFSVPHELIPLPEQPGFWSRWLPQFMKPLRLFFLCECKGCQVPHIAYHSGYKLDKPTRLIRDKTDKVTKSLTKLRIAFTIATLSGMKFSGVSKTLDDKGKEIVFSTDYFSGIVGSKSCYFKGRESSSDNDALHYRENTISLSGPGLETLKTFLKAPNGVPNGNLYQSEYQGGIFWVCCKHKWAKNKEPHRCYPRNESVERTLRLLSVAIDREGPYLGHQRRARITLESKKTAKNFYESIIKHAKGVACDLVLDVTLGWKVKADDLEDFSKMAREANFQHLAVALTNEKALKDRYIINHWDKSGLVSMEIRNFKYLSPKDPKYPWMPSLRVQPPVFSIRSRRSSIDPDSTDSKSKFTKKMKKIEDRLVKTENATITKSSLKLHKILKRMAALSVLLEEEDCSSANWVFRLEKISLGNTIISLIRDNLEIMKGIVTYTCCKDNKAGTLLYQLTSIALIPKTIGPEAPNHLGEFIRRFPFLSMVAIKHDEAGDHKFKEVVDNSQENRGRHHPSVDVVIY